MAKRLTDSLKWKKGFIRGLAGPYKLLWLFILDDCDHAGIWDVDFEIASIYIGRETDEDTAIELFGDKIIIINDGKQWFIPAFVTFQYGELNESNRAHNSVINLLKNKGLTRGLLAHKDKDKDKDKDNKKNQKAKFKIYASKLAKIILTTKKIKTPTQKLNAWATEFRKLYKIEGVSHSRIKAAMIWYRKNIGGQYIPVIESGSSFRSKFIKLEAAMKRAGDLDGSNEKESKVKRKFKVGRK